MLPLCYAVPQQWQNHLKGFSELPLSIQVLSCFQTPMWAFPLLLCCYSSCAEASSLSNDATWTLSKNMLPSKPLMIETPCQQPLSSHAVSLSSFKFYLSRDSSAALVKSSDMNLLIQWDLTADSVSNSNARKQLQRLTNALRHSKFCSFLNPWNWRIGVEHSRGDLFELSRRAEFLAGICATIETTSNVFCSLASSRWVWLTLSSLCPLF